jgi:uncharacterized membrane protein
MIGKSSLIAAAAAGLFLAGASGAASADHHEGDAKIKCEGVNSCKGKSDCKTAHNACQGKNNCKGMGYLNLTQAECDAAKAKMAGHSEKM